MKIRSHCVKVFEKYRIMGINETEKLVFSSIQKYIYINHSYIFFNTFDCLRIFQEVTYLCKKRIFSTTLMYVLWLKFFADVEHQRVQKNFKNAHSNSFKKIF